MRVRRSGSGYGCARVPRFLDEARDLSDYQRDKIILFHAIREKQAAGAWTDWTSDDRG